MYAFTCSAKSGAAARRTRSSASAVSGKRMLGLIERTRGLFDPAVGIVDRRNQVGGLGAALQHVLHTRAVRAHEPLHGAHAFLQALESRRVSVDRITIGAYVARGVFDDVGAHR